ncbi:MULTISPECIES: DUF1351 domain-containing protein [unclassified Enterococcus]|uniref:DUF1351 domain-containing protein n=1 Tax=unclassified Enterococcus TaxID=2608891 RepID=UPI003D2D3AB8
MLKQSIVIRETLKRTISKYGKTKKEIAKSIHVSQQTLSDWTSESKPMPVTLENAQTLTDYFRDSDFTLQIVHEFFGLFKSIDGNLVFKESDLADAKKARAELNNIVKLIDGKRKNVKAKYNEPLKAFESTINAYRKDIEDVSQKIDVQVKEFETNQKKEREQIVLSAIEKIVTENDIEPSRIEVDKK